MMSCIIASPRSCGRWFTCLHDIAMSFLSCCHGYESSTIGGGAIGDGDGQGWAGFMDDGGG